MKVEREDRSVHHQKMRRSPWLVVGIITTINFAVLFTLAKTGWGITIDLNKLSEAVHVNGSKNNQDIGHERITPSTYVATSPQPTITTVRPDTPRQAPVDWSVTVNKFNSVFIKHSACDPDDMKWTQMDCSNFRARAMKRFQIEWSKNSYWNGYQIIENALADRVVNSEILD
ncbi:hypothetical protein FQZ97_623160 [compost metagenome]